MARAAEGSGFAAACEAVGRTSCSWATSGPARRTWPRRSACWRASRRAPRFFTASSLVDELGFLPLDADGARPLFQVVSEACGTQPVVFTTSLELSRWGSVFGDDQMAAAVIDRVVHHGRLLQFRGESYRVRHALMQ